MEQEAPRTAHSTNNTMGGLFNKLGNCLTFATLTGYSKAEIRHVNEEDVKCRLLRFIFSFAFLISICPTLLANAFPSHDDYYFLPLLSRWSS